MPTTRYSEIESNTSQRLDLKFDHLDHMLTDIGIWQHASGNEPHERHGYSIDDEARGLIVGLLNWKYGIEPGFNSRLAKVCFQFIENAALTSGPNAGRYHNFCDRDGKWLDSIGSDDSFGRTLWGLGVAHAVNAPFIPRKRVEKLLLRSLEAVDDRQYLRAKAFVILGLGASELESRIMRGLADDIADAYEANADKDWSWFENFMTYCNARLPQAMFTAAMAFPEEARYLEIGQRSLDFLLKVTQNDKGGYSPIGNAPMAAAGWFNRGDKHPPLFDQQPVDAGALVECCAAAYVATREPRFRKAALDAFGWYFGQNVHQMPVYNFKTGGVSDALTRSGLNRNEGAESVLSIHLAHLAILSIV